MRGRDKRRRRRLSVWQRECGRRRLLNPERQAIQSDFIRVLIVYRHSFVQSYKCVCVCVCGCEADVSLCDDDDLFKSSGELTLSSAVVDFFYSLFVVVLGCCSFCFRSDREIEPSHRLRRSKNSQN